MKTVITYRIREQRIFVGGISIILFWSGGFELGESSLLVPFEESEEDDSNTNRNDDDNSRQNDVECLARSRVILQQ